MRSWYTDGRWDRDAIEADVVGVRMPWSVLPPEGLLTPTASPDLVKEFETVQDVELPPEYRSFLTEVTSGSVLWLPGFDRREVEPQFGFWANFLTRDDLYSQPFPYTDVADVSTADDENEAFSGTWMLGDSGCATGSMLVICGSASGEVWDFDNGILSPCRETTGGRQHFGSWFCAEIYRTISNSARE